MRGSLADGGSDVRISDWFGPRGLSIQGIHQKPPHRQGARGGGLWHGLGPAGGLSAVHSAGGRGGDPRRVRSRDRAGRVGKRETIVANRVRGVRCTLCWNVETARLARSHNDANVLSLGERTITDREATAIVDAWMTTPFEGGRHQRRIELIDSVGS